LSKLLKLKEWLTVPDAARHLSILLKDGVSEADVLRLALDGRLKLSVFFPKPTPALFGTIITVDDVSDHLPGDRLWDYQEGQDEDPEAYMERYYGWSSNEDTILIDKRSKQVLQVRSHQKIDGVLDLTMRGGERYYIENRYLTLISANNKDTKAIVQIESIPVVRNINEQGSIAYGLLPTPVDYLPIGSLLVVRTAAIQELQAGVLKPLAKRERDALLVIIIAALAKLAKVDLTRPSTSAKAIETQIFLMGAQEPKARAIENHLNRAAEVLSDRR
jgi:hypothetical protein